jgi:hypothetical protein
MPLTTESPSQPALADAHGVPSWYCRQPPLPSHSPSFWQVAAASAAQSPCGSAPAAAKLHWPSGPEPPTLSAALHAWHGWSQAVSQHTPSTQCPELHSPELVQAPPCARSAWQVESLVRQYALRAQFASVAQAEPHAALEPVHTFGAQLGMPGEPAASSVQVPSCVAPAICAHTSHGPPHVVSQQKPSTQPPALAQTRQPATRQSPPATVSQLARSAFCGRHVPSAAQ